MRMLGFISNSEFSVTGVKDLTSFTFSPSILDHVMVHFMFQCLDIVKNVNLSLLWWGCKVVFSEFLVRGELSRWSGRTVT